MPRRSYRRYYHLEVAACLFLGLIPAFTSNVTTSSADQLTPYQSAVLADSPVGYWPFEPNGPAPFYQGNDLSGHGNFFGASAPVADSPLGAGDYSERFPPRFQLSPSATLPEQHNNFTLEFWVKPDSSRPPAREAILDLGATTGFGYFYGFLISIDTTGELLYSGHGGFDDFNSDTGYSFPTGGQWYHVAISVAPDSLTTTYVDGQAVGPPVSGPSVMGPATPGPYPNDLLVGTEGNTPDGQARAATFSGEIDELAYYTHALTAAQALAHFSAASPVSAITLTNVNNTGDPFYDNTFPPNGSEIINVSISSGFANADLYVDGAKSFSVLSGGQFTWKAPSALDGTPLYKAHSLTVDAVDNAGNVLVSNTLTLYALVSVTGTAVSLLPSGAVTYNPFSTESYDVSCLNGSLPASSCVGQPPTSPPNRFRQIHTLTVEGKSDGISFVVPPRLNPATQQLGTSFICDGLPNQAQLGGQSLTGPFADGAYVGFSSFLKSRVNLTIPDVFSVPVPPGSTGPTSQSPFVPFIYSSFDAEVSPTGAVKVAWDPSGNSLFPFHYLYKNGQLLSSSPTPTPDVVAWATTAAQTPSKIVTSIIAQLPPGLNGLAKHAIAGIDLDTLASVELFGAARADCARTRFAALNKLAPDGTQIETYLQAHFPGIPIWWLIPHFVRSNILPHLNDYEISQGVSLANFFRSSVCVVAGCPGLEKAKVIGIFSPINADVYDAAGNHSGPRPDGTLEQAMPSVTYLTFGDMKYLIVPNDPSYRIVLSGTNAGSATIDVADYNGPTRLHFEQYYQIDVTPQSKGTMSLGALGTTLSYDAQGSGTPATLIPASVSTSNQPETTDTVAPVSTASLLGIGGQPSYFRSPVTARLSATDDLSGVSETDYSLDGGITWTPYSGAIVETADGSYSLSYRSIDYAGNQEATKSVAFVIDTTPPAIAPVSPTVGPYVLNQSVAASYTCSDDRSGIQTCNGTVTNGSQVAMNEVGTKVFAISAKDNAGNVATDSVTYSVSYAICPLYDQTKAVKSGATVPIKLELCDTNGVDVSSVTVVVTSSAVYQVSTNAPTTLMAPGNANPDSNFRFDSSLGTGGGYIYNLKTDGLSAGTYVLIFSVGSDPQMHSVQFGVQK